MSNYLRPVVAGDVGDTRVVTLNGVNNLDAVTAIEAHVWLPGETAATLTTTVTDSANTQVTVEFGDVGGWLPSATPGRYLFEIEVTFGATVLTWPQNGPDKLTVRQQGA